MIWGSRMILMRKRMRYREGRIRFGWGATVRSGSRKARYVPRDGPEGAKYPRMASETRSSFFLFESLMSDATTEQVLCFDLLSLTSDWLVIPSTMQQRVIEQLPPRQAPWVWRTPAYQVRSAGVVCSLNAIRHDRIYHPLLR